MPIPVPRTLVDRLLLGPDGDRRQLQDSPVLGDVWLAFAEKPDEPHDLLITPLRRRPAADVAASIDAGIERRKSDDAQIACLSNLVAAHLRFEELLRIVVPMTQWWHGERSQRELAVYLDPAVGPARLDRTISAALNIAQGLAGRRATSDHSLPSAIDRFIALAGIVLWAARQKPSAARRAGATPEQRLAAALTEGSGEEMKSLLRMLMDNIPAEYKPKTKSPDIVATVFNVSRNRKASLAIFRSVPAVKADAARRLFEVSCSEITWAVLDAGIDLHPAFLDRDRKASRVRKVFDFTNFRIIASISNSKPAVAEANAKKICEPRAAGAPGSRLDSTKIAAILRTLADDSRAKRPFDWEAAEKLIALSDPPVPPTDHGTHVAGIIGGSGRIAGAPLDEEHPDGMCPDINLYDFRILAPDLAETEFAIIAALQYIRYVNERDRAITIHGANLSLQIPHDVRNYACGLTPVCVECERLVDSGVVVVAAAGNLGYRSYETRAGSYEGYAPLSLTDPGNAEGVITVGSTHRYSPHSYGVSFFSSRGPTGDGRMKPDLVAPGERIRSTIREQGWGDLDGTSMAAPHVSGAAAMLMARYSELIGQPRRIKRILCDSATDLGRERAFQGHGMLDVLRALQSI
ncbi:MAG: S8 family peptidase [Geminicoccaceae bacterium]